MGKAKYCAQCGTYLQRRDSDSAFCGKTCYRQSLAETDSDDSDVKLEITRSIGQSRRGPRPLKPGDRRIPRPPNLSSVKPRLSYLISFGDYKGEPNFLVWSRKGLSWANIPSALRRICDDDDMKHRVLDFSLGTEGKYYFVWKDGKEARMETSPGLWEYLNVDFQGGSIRTLQFGAEGTAWGIRSFIKHKARSRESTYEEREEPFGQIPDSLMRKIKEIYPSMEYSDPVDFVTVGKGGSWVMGAMQGLCFWDGIEGKLLRKVLKLYNQGGGLKNVVTAPTTNFLYVIETQDGTIHYRVFDEWDDTIRRHLQPRSTARRESGVSRTLHPPRARSPRRESESSALQRFDSRREVARSGGDSRSRGYLVPSRASYDRDWRGSRDSYDREWRGWRDPYDHEGRGARDPYAYDRTYHGSRDLYGPCGHYPTCYCHREQDGGGGDVGETVVAAMMAGSTLVGAGVQVAAMTGCTIM